MRSDTDANGINKGLRCLTLSGSLRAASSNAIVLRVAAQVAPAHVDVEPYTGLADLPHFNPDRDIDPAPPAVAHLRAELRRTQMLMICSPEYAHGVPGSLKNGLDWLVSGVELMDMPVALINASQYSTYAFAALKEIIRTMGARIVPEACVTLQLAGKPNEAELMADSATRDQLQRAWAALVASVDAAHLE